MKDLEIYGTFGPNCQSKDRLIQLIEAGMTRGFNTSQNYRFSYQPIKWTFSFTFLVKFLDFLYRIFSYVMV